MEGLGFLPGSDPSGESETYAVSVDGSAVVGSAVRFGITNAGEDAFIWDAANGMRGLSTVLAAFGLDLTDWSLGTATGISADGLTIVGRGTHDGQTQAWIARLDAAPVPLPAAVWLFGSALAGMGLIGRRRETATAKGQHFGQQDGPPRRREARAGSSRGLFSSAGKHHTWATRRSSARWATLRSCPTETGEPSLGHVPWRKPTIEGCEIRLPSTRCWTTAPRTGRHEVCHVRRDRKAPL